MMLLDAIWNVLIASSSSSSAVSQQHPNWFGAAPINWCETDYAVVPGVAEFWNTISNLGFIVVGMYGLEVCSRFYLSWRMISMCVCVVMTGVTSAWFHATLYWIGQKSDEFFENSILVVMWHSNGGFGERPAGVGVIVLHLLVLAVGLLYVTSILVCEIHLISIIIACINQFRNQSVRDGRACQEIRPFRFARLLIGLPVRGRSHSSRLFDRTCFAVPFSARSDLGVGWLIVWGVNQSDSSGSCMRGGTSQLLWHYTKRSLYRLHSNCERPAVVPSRHFSACISTRFGLKLHTAGLRFCRYHRLNLIKSYNTNTNCANKSFRISLTVTVILAANTSSIRLTHT